MDPQILERMEKALAQVPDGNWEGSLVSAAMVIELMEACSAALRVNGARHEAALLDNLRRSFLDRRRSRQLQQGGDPAEKEPITPRHLTPQQGRRVPGSGRVIR
jgi:hypothetical protein